MNDWSTEGSGAACVIASGGIRFDDFVPGVKLAYEFIILSR